MELKELLGLINGHDFWWSMVDEQRKWDIGYKTEEQIRQGLKDFLWDDIEPNIKEDWKKEQLMKLL